MPAPCESDRAPRTRPATVIAGSSRAGRAPDCSCEDLYRSSSRPRFGTDLVSARGSGAEPALRSGAIPKGQPLLASHPLPDRTLLALVPGSPDRDRKRDARLGHNSGSLRAAKGSVSGRKCVYPNSGGGRGGCLADNYVPRETKKWRKRYSGRASIEREFGHIDENWHFNDKQKEVRRTDSIAGLFLQGVLGLALLKLWKAEQAGPARRKTRQQAVG